MNITIDNNTNSIKIYINDILHLAIKKEDLIGIESWVDGENERKRWHIEYTTKTTTIESEYDNIDKWIAILKLLDNEIIW